MTERPCIGRGALAGLVAGVVATAAMTASRRFWARATGDLGTTPGEPGQEHVRQSREQPTIKIASAVQRRMRGDEPDRDDRVRGGLLVHYAFGALAGAAYGALAERLPAASAGAGTLYGTAVWLAADEVALPALRLARPPQAHALTSHATALGTHLVYGAALEAARRTLRRAI